jgi:hypothetical protein
MRSCVRRSSPSSSPTPSAMPRSIGPACRSCGVEVGEHDAPDIARADAELLQLRADLLLGLDVLADGEAEERLPAREVAGLGDAGGLARVDDDDAFGVLDREGVDRQRLGPLAIEQRVEQPPPAVANALAPARRQRDGARLDRMDVHVRRSRTERTDRSYALMASR